MTIKEISDMYDLSPDTLRFYEKRVWLVQYKEQKVESETIVNKI